MSAPAKAQVGMASYYKSGRKTANGERFNPNGLTAAHRSLKFGTRVRVTNLRNGRSVVVRINDRGPFVANRLIDLSYTAAAKLDMLREGTTLVEVRTLTPGIPDTLTRTAETPPPDLYVQAGAFADEGNARRLLERLKAGGIANAFIASPLTSRSRLFRVRAGPVASTTDFDQLVARLKALGVPDAKLAAD